MGGAASEVSRRDADASRSRARTSSRRRSGGRASGSASRPRRRRASSAAPTSTRRSSRLQRAVALMEQIGAGRVVGPIIDRYPRPRGPTTLHLRRAAARARCSAVGARSPRSSASCAASGLTVDADGRRVGRRRADVPRRSAARGRSHRGSRPALRLRQARRRRFPSMTAPAPPPDPAHPARSAGAPGADGGRPVRSGDVRVHRGDGRRGVRAGRRPARPGRRRQSAVGQVRHAAAVAAAGPGRRRRAQPPARPARRARCSRSAPASRVATARRAASALAWTGGDAGALVRRRAARSTSSTSRASSSSCATRSASPLRFEPAATPFLVAGQAARRAASAGDATGSASSVRSRRRSPNARGLPRQDRVFVAELDLDPLAARARARRATRRGRCRGIRSSSAICRSSSPTPCLRKSFVAPFRRPRRAGAGAARRASAFFDRYQGKGVPDGCGQPVGAADVPGADRTLTDAEVQQSVDTILAALVREHGAVQR